MPYKLGIMQGDYIGPEITAEALKVLNAASAKYGVPLEYENLPASGEAYDLYGEHLPKSTLKKAAECDALLKGPFGGPTDQLNHPKWMDVEKNALLPLRKHFNFYANFRETKVYPSLIGLSPLKQQYIDGVNILIVRELVSGIYFGEKGERTVNSEREFYDVESYRESEIRRIAMKAFEAAEKRKGKITLVAKSNVLKSSVLWREVVGEVRFLFPGVAFDYMHVDNAAMQLMLNPKQFDVILTSNMFGDILSDEVSVLSGSIGLFPSVSIGDGPFALYEPIHGSAPDLAGKNAANPLSAILCIPLLFRHTVGNERIALDIEKAIQITLSQGYRTRDLAIPDDDRGKILGTREMGDKIAEVLMNYV